MCVADANESGDWAGWGLDTGPVSLSTAPSSVSLPGFASSALPVALHLESLTQQRPVKLVCSVAFTNSSHVVKKQALKQGLGAVRTEVPVISHSVLCQSYLSQALGEAAPECLCYVSWICSEGGVRASAQ